MGGGWEEGGLFKLMYSGENIIVIVSSSTQQEAFQSCFVFLCRHFMAVVKRILQDSLDGLLSTADVSR